MSIGLFIVVSLNMWHLMLGVMIGEAIYRVCVSVMVLDSRIIVSRTSLVYDWVTGVSWVGVILRPSSMVRSYVG